MKHYKNLTIIGTSHISKQSLNEIKEKIEKEKPDIIAIELDKERLFSLLSKNRKKSSFSFKQVFKIGLKGFLFAWFGSFISRKLGEKTGIFPGSDMLLAFKLAMKNKIPIALIDQNINITLRKISKTFSLKEKIRFIKLLLLTPFLKKSEKIVFDLNKVPEEEVISFLITRLKKEFPSLYKVLVEERNLFMAKKLKTLMEKYKKVLVVVGAGHEQGIINFLQKL